MLLALGAILAANMSAQDPKRNCSNEFPGQSQSAEQRVETDIRYFIKELYLSDKQADNFANTYREYAAKLDAVQQKLKPAKQEDINSLTDKELDKLAKQRFAAIKELSDLKSKYYDKFRKDLNAKQVAKVLRLNEQKGCCGGRCAKPGQGCCQSGKPAIHGPHMHGPHLHGKPGQGQPHGHDFPTHRPEQPSKVPANN